MAKKKKVSEEFAFDQSSITITRSFTRKLNMSAHGGKQYETADIACAVSCITTIDKMEQASKELDEFCIKNVQETIDVLDGDAAEIEEAEVKPTKKKKVLDVGIKVEQEEFEEIQTFVNDLTMAKNAKDLKAAVESIQKNSKNFTKEQKEYLSAYYLKRKEAIL